MESKFGRGFLVTILNVAKHFALPPEQAFYGASDHLDELILPSRFRGTEVETLTDRLRNNVIWHQPGINDKEDAAEVNRILNRLAVAVDRELGIENAEIGKYD